ncbi:hypothetical protein [Pedobacter metabolipauper]|uniref:Circularly permuted ATP-grasp superfamily protein n=1 Tax=Pedobacter metabolipauper TaxID=425513 RepID=A0A4R6SWP7_9SPHI|nr:hypothetical protein [Pedobacter metabolipauper]TDQ09829.1 hypothetical protein ATK78_1988 [Pedobacter metabolipauper]
MISKYRDFFNNSFSEEKYSDFLKSLNAGFPPIPFRVAETPVFIPADLKQKLVDAGSEIIKLIKRPDFKQLTDGSVPAEWNVPNENDHPHFLTFDFGVCKDPNGHLVPKLIEMQGFPSLYGFQLHLAQEYKKCFNLPDNLSPLFDGVNGPYYIELLKKVILGNCEPYEVALMDVDAPDQKTSIDFFITQKYLGIKILSLTDIFKEGKSLFYQDGDRKVRLKRIYNRLIFDEVTDRTDVFKSCFDPREELDIEWVTHPNWFYRISKYTMPFLKSEFVPESLFLKDLKVIPSDLENYVLKPLFSFAGLGVIIDVKKEDIDQVKDPENWILQRKVNYEPAVKALSDGVKAEIRLMYLWPDEGEPILCINLARLSRGKMIGVRYNKDFDWVGGTVGLMEQ